MTVKDPMTATNAHISVIGHITEDELRALLNRTDMANGFANRFLFALVKRSKELPLGGNLDDSETLRLGNKLQSIIWAVEGDPLSERVSLARVTMTEQAKELWGDLYRELTHERPGLLGAITARAAAQTIRLATIYALLDKANQIDLPHLKAALAVWNYCDASAIHIFGDTLGDEVADRILRMLKQTGAINRTSINQLFSGHQTKDRIEGALQLLAEKGRARFEIRGGTGGRPNEIWSIVR